MTLKTLDNALELLKFFSEETPEWGVRELAKAADISHSIVYRILATYEKHGFLRQNQESKKYELGIRFWEYGLIVKDKFLPDIVSTIMTRLAEQTGESIFLTWLDGTEGICVEIAESTQNIKFAVSIGTRSPLYVGAWTKVMMAYLSREQQEFIVKQGLMPRTDKTVVDTERLFEDLEKIRQDGWCYSVGEYSESVFGLGLPLFNSKGEIMASITAAGPAFRMPEEKVPKVLKILLDGRDEIQECIGRFGLNYTAVHPV